MKTNKPDMSGWLRLDIQHFAEGGGEPVPPTPPAEPPTPPVDEPKFTQADLDRAIGERLAREKQKAEKAVEEAKAEAERKRLEEANEFKALYEAEKLAREQAELERQAERLQATKQSLLIKAGYPADKLEDVLGFISGDDEDAIKASVERFKAVAPPTPAFVDPATGGGGRQQPAQKDGTELGKAMYERIKHRLR